MTSSGRTPTWGMKRVFFWCVAAVFLGAFGVQSAEKPNVVLFFADDLGYGDVGYQGGDVATPHIDSIAKNGLIFTDGYVTCPVCAPSRAAVSNSLR